MTRALTMALAAAAALAAGTARAGDIEADVRARVDAALPADLAVDTIELSPALRAVDAQRVGLSWRGAPRAGIVTVQVIAHSAGGETVRGWARLALVPVRRVLVAARALEEGRAIGAGDLTMDARAVARGQGWQMAPAALLGRRVLRDVPAGAVIGPEDVEEPAPVARGTDVTVVVARGAVRVEAAGVLERSARPGERTAVRLLATRRVVSGILIDSTTVVMGGR
ncbi:MAG: flagella basal body P-ring formation protein FlgA [Deltaproteobacteria bacterium]|nr:MAG: flagella basal body P-ring formation protein FlgA [Deltaproteobacteria bacterium]